MPARQYLINCVCGEVVKARGSSAGATAECPACKTPMLLPCLTELNRGRSEIVDVEPAWPQFSLADIMFYVSMVCVAFGYSRLTNPGYAIVLAAGAIYARLLVKFGEKLQRTGGFALFAFEGFLLIAALWKQR